ncbi:hypothetical protein D3C75_815840 [compost metagenome]
MGAILIDPLLVRALRPRPVVQQHGKCRRRGKWLQHGMIRQALDRDRDHVPGRVERPGALDLFRLVGVILGAVAVHGLDIATSLLGPQAVGACVDADHQGQQGSDFQRWMHDGSSVQRLRVRLTLKLRGSPGSTQALLYERS